MFHCVSSVAKRAAVALSLCGAAAVFAHFAWLSPAPAKAAVGETVIVRMSSGHSFPTGGEPVKDIDLKLTAFTPSGKSVILAPADNGQGLEAAFKVESEGVYVVAGEYDRGVVSRTPEGLKPGGKSKNPNATSTMKSYSSFICTVRASAPVPLSSVPLGLRFELSWKREGRSLSVSATAEGKPVEAAEISAVVGSGDAKAIGKTDAAGGIAIEIPESFRGPILLIGSVSKPMPSGSDYDTDRTGCTVFLDWE